MSCKKILATIISLSAVLVLFVIPVHAENSSGQQEMYRLYNPNSGEHFYTASTKERDHLDHIGWNYEGVGWIAPEKSSTPVYRLYNKNAGEHHYTTNVNEKNHLVSVGWKDEGIGWYSDDHKGVALLREYNPNQFSCNHNYTTSQKEHNHLVSLGWRDEGTAWYGVKESVSEPASTSKTENDSTSAPQKTAEPSNNTPSQSDNKQNTESNNQAESQKQVHTKSYSICKYDGYTVDGSDPNAGSLEWDHKINVHHIDPENDPNDDWDNTFKIVIK